jgi:hypothetical protein
MLLLNGIKYRFAAQITGLYVLSFHCFTKILFLVFFKYIIYLHKNIYKQQIKRWKGIYNGAYILFRRTNIVEIKSE